MMSFMRQLPRTVPADRLARRGRRRRSPGPRRGALARPTQTLGARPACALTPRTPRAAGRGRFALLCVARGRASSSSRRIPNYDSLYALLWGRDLLHLHAADFEGYRAPTEHPLAIAFGALLLALRRQAATACGPRARSPRSSRWSPGSTGSARPRSRRSSASSPRCCCSPASTSRSSPPAATSTSRTWRWSCGRPCSRSQRPRRGAPVLVLLALGRAAAPRGVGAAGLYWLWVGWPAHRGRQRIALRGAAPRSAPVVWVLRRLRSSPATRCSRCTTRPARRGARAHQGRWRRCPPRCGRSSIDLVKLPVVLGALAGLRRSRSCSRRAARRDAARAVRVGRRRRSCSSAPAGLSVIERYLLVAVARGAGVLRASRSAAGRCCATARWLRRVWIGAALLLVLFGVAFTATRVNLDALRHRAAVPRRLPRRARSTLHRRARRQARRCAAGRLRCRTTSWSPTRAGSSTCRQDEVVARAGARDAQAAAQHGRRASVVYGRQALLQPGARRPSRRPARPGAAARLPARRSRAVLRRVCPLLRTAPRRRTPTLRPRARRATAARAASLRAGVWARRSPASSLVALALRLWGAAAGAALRLQRRRERALRAAGDRDVRPRPRTRTTSSTRRPSRTCCTSCFAVWLRRAAAVARRLRDRPDDGVRRSRASPRAVLGTLAVGLLYLAGRAALRPRASGCSPRRCWPSRSCRSSTAHLALNDVPTLAPLCLALCGAAGVLRRRAARRDYARRGRRPRPGVRRPSTRRDRAAAAARGARRRTRRATGGRARCAASLLAGARARSRRSSSPTRTRCSTSARSATG